MSNDLQNLKCQFEKIVHKKQDLLLAVPREARDDAWQNIYYCLPISIQVPTLQRHLNAFRKSQPAVAAQIDPIIARAESKAKEIAQAKDAAALALAAKKQARIDKVADTAATKKNPYRNLHTDVARLLREVAEPYRVKAQAEALAREQAVVAEITERAAKCGSFSLSRLYPINHRTATKSDLALHRICVQQAVPYIESVDSKSRLNLSANSIAQRRAELFAEDMVVAFVTKVGGKLSGLVERKTVTETSISGSLSNHWMSFKFSDGSSFLVQSQIVWVWNSNGTHFARYPTCFRNVIMKDGSKMELPSEIKMKEEFV